MREMLDEQRAVAFSDARKNFLHQLLVFGGAHIDLRGCYHGN
jgi:hypothetical protein